MRKIEIFDSTLRDGAQGGNVNFSGEDKFNILKALDEFGVSFIEAGNPASNPKDEAFFRRASDYNMKNATLVAFGSTRKKDCHCRDDNNVTTLVDAGTDTVCIFGKSWDMHVTEIIKTSLEENLAMIADTVSYLSGLGKEVFYDAEHFFDGCLANRDYAIKTIQAAAGAGAKRIILCDTNGGCFPDIVKELTALAVKALEEYPDCYVGIHCHNDTGCAVANSIAAVTAGATHVQGTFNGIGERCGNANLVTLIANLQIKLGYSCVPSESLALLTKSARYISEVSNLVMPENAPFVGQNAFTHKAGMHVDGVMKNSSSFEHIPPSCVGNERMFKLSEMAGRNAILSKLQAIAPHLDKHSTQTSELIQILKQQEYKGFQYEAAEASFNLLVKRHLGVIPEYFELVYFKLIGEKSSDEKDSAPSSAMIKVRVGNRFQVGAAEGQGPVDAIDAALRSALIVFYPVLNSIRLTDYKVRVMDGTASTAAVVRVLIDTTDGVSSWGTVGASSDIINASVMALTDSIIYKLAQE